MPFCIWSLIFGWEPLGESPSPPPPRAACLFGLRAFLVLVFLAPTPPFLIIFLSSLSLVCVWSFLAFDWLSFTF